MIDILVFAWLMLAAQAPPEPAPPAAPPEPQPPAASGDQATAGNRFNPSISLIPDVVYYNDNREGAADGFVAGADGFASAEAEGGHDHGSGLERGFNLREVEVAFSAAVDPYFDAWAILAIGGGEIEAEEAYVQTRRLLPGLQVRAGKFYSGIGYLNSKHPHEWDFVDRPLPYTLLLGGALNETGVRATWLPALPVYALFGAEVLQGENARFSQHLGDEEAEGLADRPGPRLFTAFAKLSPPLGHSHTLQVGASAVRSRLHQEFAGDEPALEPLEGASTLLGVDVVYHYDSPRQWGAGDLRVQGEYFWRLQDLAVASAPGGSASRRRSQDAVYVQAVYGIAQRWRAGLRFDAAGMRNLVRTPGGELDLAPSRRYTADLTYLPTEFSRLRLQYTRGDAAVHGVREKSHQAWVQLQVSLGTHGAHRF
ncbi:MAG TPA: hypothetical protein VK911_08655 [Vicinamibacterales bacterium]|nr:hypothetical protein [Vicinamibacterales bacterium]